MRTIRRRLLAVRLITTLAAGAVLVPALPVIRMLVDRPVDIVGREVVTTIDHERLVRLPIAASHVSLHWTGAPDAQLTLALGSSPGGLGEEIPFSADDDARPEGNESYSEVFWADGARFARVTSDRPISHLTVVAIDADEDRTVSTDGIAVADAATGQPAVITRAGWGANESYRFNAGGYERWAPEFLPLQKLIVHHTAGRNNDPNPAATIRAIYYDHAVIRGWGDIDYNFLIDAQGRIYEGRHARAYGGEIPTGEDLAGNVVRGAHAKYFNDATMGVSLLGNFTSVMPTAAARTALVNLLAWKAERHGIDPKGASMYVNPALGNSKWLYNISGHRNVNATACPGELFYNSFPKLRQDVANRIAATTGASTDHTPPSVLSLLPTVPSPTGSHTIPYGLIFSEPVSGLAAGDFTLGGTSSRWSVASITGSASTYTVTVVANESGPPIHDGTVELTLAAGSVSDRASLRGPTSAKTSIANFAEETTAPTVVLWSNPPKSPTKSNTFGVSVTFSEPISGLDPTDVKVGGTSNASTPWTVQRVYGTGASYNFTINNANPANGSLAFLIPAGAVKDLAGNPTQASNTIQYAIDRTAPVTSTPWVTLAAGSALYGSSMPATVKWTGADVGPAGIAAYEIARSYDGAAFKVLNTSLSGPSAGVLLTPGHTYRYEVRGRDKAGNVGAWKAGPTLKPSLTQQTSTAVHYSGTFRTGSSTSYSGGSVRYATAAGASASYTVSARSLSFVTTRGPTRGAVKVYVDGTLAATIDLYAATSTYRYVAFVRVWGTASTHTFKVVVVGTAGRPRVDVDGFGVVR
jgi:hypothetical protein